MDLVDRARLQELAEKAGKPGGEERFAEEYAALLAELTAALKLMRGVAQLQTVWLRDRAGAAARLN